MTPIERTLDGALRELARVPRLLVALDFDGTLAPTVDSPEHARALPEAREAVLRLVAAAGTRVAVVSGRALESLEHVADLPDSVLLVGSHGVELRLDGPGDGLILEATEQVQLDVLMGVLAHVAEEHDRVWVEEKPVGFALHTRLASEADSRIAHLVALSEATAEVQDLTVRRGKDVLEFAVRETTKGDAIEHLRRYVRADAVLYAGDDTTDEDAFDALDVQDVGIKIGAGPSQAQFHVAGPWEFAAVLAALAVYREGDIHEQ